MMPRVLLFMILTAFCAQAYAQNLEGLRFETLRVAGVQGDEVRATLAFGADSVNGKGGCNQYSGAYRFTGARRIRFGSLISTRMYCGAASAFETRYFSALERTRVYRMRGRELTLLTGGRKPRVLVVLRQID